MRTLLYGVVVVAWVATVTVANTSLDQPIIKPGDRIVFLGDSNTYAGKYIAYLEAAMPDSFGVELINLGLSSETASGLSEPDHPFPRPCVLDRLDNALKLSKPNIVVACYGMNDGIYYPFSAERFAKYKQGIQTIVRKSRAAGAKVVLMTPPPFDPVPLQQKNKLRPAGAEKYAWFAPYKDYDEVMQKYAGWIMEQNVDASIDLHTSMNQHLRQARASKPDFMMTNDGVHFFDAGHQFVAELLSKQLGLPVSDKPSNDAVRLAVKRQNILRDAWLTHVGHSRPGVKPGLPLQEAQQKAKELRLETVPTRTEKRD